MKFGIYLIHRGLIDAETFINAIEAQLMQRPLLGTLAIESGKLSMRDVFDILGDQADSQLPFGQIAVDKKFICHQELAELILKQLERTRPLVDILVDSGALSLEVASKELARFRSMLSDHSAATDDTIFCNTLSSIPSNDRKPRKRPCRKKPKQVARSTKKRVPSKKKLAQR